MEKGLSPPKAFALLTEMQQCWRQQFAGTRGSASFKDFNHTLAELRAQAESGGMGDEELDAVQAKLNATKSVMTDSIEKVLERGEKIELLVDKTDRLNQQAFKFEKTSKQLRDQMFWRKVKTYLMIAFAVALTIFIITLAACGGFRFKKCRNPDETSE